MLKDLLEAFYEERNKIGEIEEKKNQQINDMCKLWINENSKYVNGIKLVYDELNKINEKFSKELENQSKKLDDSILLNKLENFNIKNDFKILKKY